MKRALLRAFLLEPAARQSQTICDMAEYIPQCMITRPSDVAFALFVVLQNVAKKQIKKILIVRTDKLGDMVLTLPMARAIKDALPGCTVAIMARPYTSPLVKVCKDVDEVVEYNGSYFFSLIQQFRSVKPDAVVLLSPKARYAIAAFFAGIPIRIGKGYRWYSLFTNKKIFEHRKNAERNEAAYNIRMLEPLGITPNEDTLAEFDTSKLPANALTFKKYVVLHTVTGGSGPSWDAGQWVEFAGLLNQKHALPVILTGVPSDSEFLLILSERMKQAGADVHILAGADLVTLIRVLADATLVVSGSTGPGHIAAAMGAPTIGLFPLVKVLSKERWGFRGEHAVNISPPSAVKAECPMCKDCICIETITTSSVMQAAEELIKK
jgi:ADP-heptose:LPS heptosyltransferase